AVNVRDLSGKSLFRPDTIFRMDGISVGVFGIATPETKTAADPRIVAGLTFDDPKQAAVNIVDTLKARGCDIIIALTHLGNDVLAAVPGIDVIVDGHSHELFMSGKSVNNVLIGQAGEHGKYIGVIEIAVSGGAVVSKTAKVIAVPGGDGEIDSGGLVPDSAVIAKISEEEAKMEQITSVVIGKTSVLLQGERDSVRTRRTNLTDMVTNSMLHATGADIALLTGGNIRAGIAAGDITMGQVLTVLPFSNLLVTLELSGADILSALEHGVSRYPEPAAQYIHAAGINFEFDPNAEPVKRITKVTMANGKALDASGTYTVATIEFIAAGGDGYNMMSNGKNLVYYGGDAEALARYLGQ
ncbi:MAG: 5'-nucleotidase C-terminal domain-containing protein, partial [Chitinispirillia bacterium]|nr:5'-nucleotidase C-terminal domain-containing protein [Chitinispirillia bacterium]